MTKQLKDEDYIKLGKQFQVLLDKNYSVLRPAWGIRIRNASVRGFFSGIGGVVGATLGITLLLFLLNAFGALPVIGEFFVNIARQISSGS